MINPQEYFKENNYVVIRNHMDISMCVLMYEYCKTVVKSIDFVSTYNPKDYDEYWHGAFGDPQVLHAYKRYGDPLMDTVLNMSKPIMEQYTGLNLYSNYTYWRLYEKGNDLYKHTDRNECEISATICLGYDVSNVDNSIYPSYNWPIYIETSDGTSLPIHLNPGDMLIYRGNLVKHWREEFIGLNHAQLFIHYGDTAVQHKQFEFDGRPMLGLPIIYKREMRRMNNE